MEIAQIIPHVESLIFASDHPLPPMEIMTLLNNSQGFLEDVATPDQVMSAIEAIREKYNSEFYAFEVRESGGGYQFLTKSEYFPTVAQLNGDKYLKRLSTAAMETLAIIAYKQPITKSDIESIRGVNSDYSIQKLLEKDLVVISGRREDLVGKPLVYITSRSFMDYFGINSADDLPKIKEVFREELAQPTLLDHTPNPDADDEGYSHKEPGSFAVSENGELLGQDELLSGEDLREESESEGAVVPGVEQDPNGLVGRSDEEDDSEDEGAQHGADEGDDLNDEDENNDDDDDADDDEVDEIDDDEDEDDEDDDDVDPHAPHKG